MARRNQTDCNEAQDREAGHTRVAKNNAAHQPAGPERQQTGQAERADGQAPHAGLMFGRVFPDGGADTLGHPIKRVRDQQMDGAEWPDDPYAMDEAGAQRCCEHESHPDIAQGSVPFAATVLKEKKRRQQCRPDGAGDMDLDGGGLMKKDGRLQVPGAPCKLGMGLPSLRPNAKNPLLRRCHMIFAKYPFLQFAKREMRDELTDIRVWIALLATALVVAVIGPFGTDAHLLPAPRLVYWGCLIVVAYFSGSLVVSLAARWRRGADGPALFGHMLACLLVSVMVLTEILAINWIAFGLRPMTDGYFGALAANVVGISVIVTAAMLLINGESRAVANAPRDPTAPPILRRLPLEKRGELISMTVEDHYVTIFTTRGRAMVLLRLSDAVDETAPVAGLRVHRSHWVALDQVRSARRSGAKVILTMSDGRDIPVSRTYVPLVKEAGLLPG